MIKKILFILFTVGCVLFSQFKESATSVKPRSSADFSAERAMDYLKVIAAENHPTGSKANQKVRDYLVEELTKLGLEVKVESGFVNHAWDDDFMTSAFVENVIAILPGQAPSEKKVVLMAHYDSVSEGPGAADDGYAIASMIETAKLLKDQNRKNDLMLVMTDGEELGLMGARFYAENHDMDDVGILLNYEARGNEGAGMAFEWSENNAWLVREMKHSAIRPIANSLSYEIYNLMPNSTDFTIFKEEVAGINHGFIDGFTYYHSPLDNVENISVESVQHTGENMYLMAKHFVNYDFSKEEKGNASFFNFYGYLVHYPSGWDIFFLLLLIGLFLGATILGIKKSAITFSSLLRTFGWMLLTLFIVIVLNAAFAFLITTAYPHYSTFYAFQNYNHEWYLVAGIGLSILTVFTMSRFILADKNKNSAGQAFLLLMFLLSTALFLLMPTGAYIMTIPGIISGVLVLWNVMKNPTASQEWITLILFSLIIAGIWTSLTHLTYLAFSLFALAGAIIPTILVCFGLMVLNPSIWKENRSAELAFGTLLFLGSLVIAHLESAPTKEKPLHSNLVYVYDEGADKTYIGTYNREINEGHIGLQENTESAEMPLHLPNLQHYKTTGTDLSAWYPQIEKDTLLTTIRNKHYRITNAKRADAMFIHIPDVTNADSLYVDEKLKKVFSNQQEGDFSMTILGYGQDSLHIHLVNRDGKTVVPFYISTEYSMMPTEENLPENIVRYHPLISISRQVMD